MGNLPVSDIVVVGVGARTASGLTALQVTMSARALKLDPRPSHLIDRAGEEIATARLASIGDDVVGIDRFLAIGGPTLAQAAFLWASRYAAGPPPPLPVFVALPSEARPGVDPRMKKFLLSALAGAARIPVDLERSSLIHGCRGGGAIAFERGMALLREGSVEVVAVGGIDSYFDPDILEHLDQERRLHSPDAENGFIPGEGAGFVLLALRRNAHALHRYAQVIAAASASEPRPWGGPEPSIGLGATLAIKRAAEPLGATKQIGWVLTDVANERHRVDEWGYAAARNRSSFAEGMVHDQPLLKTGDLGAASASVLLVMAAIRWQTGCAAHDCALIVTSSDGPERGALVASREQAS